MNLKKLVDYLDKLLNISDIEDDSLNGLQVENSGSVRKVALAVDASEAAFVKAGDMYADFIFVHHGLFWGHSVSVTRTLYKRMQILFKQDIALYAAHLPLDMHPELGNNAQILKVMCWPVAGDFGEYHGSILGKWVDFKKPVPFKDIVQTMKEKLNCNPIVWDFGPENITRMGYVSGGGVKMVEQAIDAGLDVYITGEPGHSSYWIAKEAGINVIFAGHYATETLGVKAIGKHLEDEFCLETEFIHLPTEL